jgi:hypothetical protein
MRNRESDKQRQIEDLEKQRERGIEKQRYKERKSMLLNNIYIFFYSSFLGMRCCMYL